MTPRTITGITWTDDDCEMALFREATFFGRQGYTRKAPGHVLGKPLTPWQVEQWYRTYDAAAAEPREPAPAAVPPAPYPSAPACWGAYRRWRHLPNALPTCDRADLYDLSRPRTRDIVRRLSAYVEELIRRRDVGASHLGDAARLAAAETALRAESLLLAALSAEMEVA